MPGISGARSQQMLWRGGVFFAVPVVGALLCYSHTGLIGLSAAVAACVALASIVIEAQRYPLHLMPIAAVFARAAGPMSGFTAAWLIALAFHPVAPNALVGPLLGSWLVLAVVGVVMDRLRRRSRIRVAVIGSPELALSLTRELEFANLCGYEVVGWIGPDPGDTAAGAIACLGPVDRVRELARSQALDLIIFDGREPGHGAGSAGPASALQLLETLSSALMLSQTRLTSAEEFFEDHFGHAPLATINAVWFRSMLHPRFRTSSPALQRLFDLLAVAVLLVPAGLVIAVCALAVKLGDRGPVLFRQCRVGEAGRQFGVLKLRTMKVDAEVDGSPEWSNANDRRVTRVGGVLRRLHLDELPQLFNILRGQMSLVGPRPERPEFIAELEEWLPYYDRRLTIKPGLTGWAQVRVGYAGSNLGSAWKLAHDLYYLKHRSVAFNALIVLETLATPIRDARMADRSANELFVSTAARGRAGMVSLIFSESTTGETLAARIVTCSSAALRRYLASARSRAALIASAALVIGAVVTNVPLADGPSGSRAAQNDRLAIVRSDTAKSVVRPSARSPRGVPVRGGSAPSPHGKPAGESSESLSPLPSQPTSGAPAPPASSAPTTSSPSPTPPAGEPPGAHHGPISAATTEISSVLGVPLDEATSDITSQADQVLHDLGLPPELD